MERTFKEKAVSKAAKIKNKHKLFTPLVVLVLSIVLGFYNVFSYFFSNSKRYISVGIIALFFIVSSSFATPDQVMDNEIYLSNQNIDNESDSLKEEENLVEDTPDIIDENESTTDNVIVADTVETIDETFTLDDLFSDVSLSSLEEANELAGFDKSAWNIRLVNKTHPIPDDYVVPLAYIKGSMRCDERALDPLKLMLNAAYKENINLIVCSPYRDNDLQVKLFRRKVDAFMAKGYSYLEAYKATSTDVIVPGTSEHQLGLAFDIVTADHQVLDWDFGDTVGGKWLHDNCATYGFILRYPSGKEYLTGIEYEPWHFRFVGVEAATYIMENEITLEEFWENLE